MAVHADPKRGFAARLPLVAILLAAFLLATAYQSSQLVDSISWYRSFPGYAVLHQKPPGSSASIEDKIAGYKDKLDAICPRRQYTSCQNSTKEGWTAANRTETCCLTVNPKGQWSHFKMRTFDANGQPITQGGDSWVIDLEHRETRSKVKGRVLDEGDGTYTVAFVPLHSGKYSILARLYFTRCLGFQDIPPENGTKSEYWERTSREDWCFINDQVILPYITLELPEAGGAAGGDWEPAPPGLAPVLRAQRHTYASGSDLAWRPMAAAQAAAWHRDTTSKASSRIVLFGDSTLLGSYTAMVAANNVDPCRMLTAPGRFWDDYQEARSGQVPFSRQCGNTTRPFKGPYRDFTLYTPFASCRAPANAGGTQRAVMTAVKASAALFSRSCWCEVVPMDQPVKEPGVLQIHYEFGYFCKPAETVWNETLRHVRAEDTLIINVGLHCILKHNWTTWTTMIDRLAPMLGALPTRNVVWRTSNNVWNHNRGWKENDSWGDPKRHFIVEPRRLLFDLYAERAMRLAGIRVLDMTHMPVDYQIYDPLHFDLSGFDLQNRVLSEAVC